MRQRTQGGGTPDTCWSTSDQGAETAPGATRQTGKLALRSWIERNNLSLGRGGGGLRRGKGSLLASIALIAGIVMVAPHRAAATAPGLNGVIAGIGGFQDRIILLNLNDGTRTALLKGGSQEVGPSWSPTGDKLVVTEGTDLVRVNADGTGKLTLVDGPCGGSGGTWSPDGSKIAFHTCTDISIIAADGTNPTAVPNTSSFGLGEWSPDGQWLVGARWVDGDYDIWKIRPNGSDLTQLTDIPGDQLSPTISPDGTTIALEDRETTDWEIDAVGIDGGSVTNLTQTAGKDFDPSWSPDGTKILFGSRRSGRRLVHDGARRQRRRCRPPMVMGSARPCGNLHRSRCPLPERRDLGCTIDLLLTLAWPGTDNPSITVQRRTATTEWTNWQTVDVDASGRVLVEATIRQHSWFRAVWSGDASHQGSMSIQARVQAKVTVSGRYLFRFYSTKSGWHLYHAGKRVWYTSDITPNRAGKKMCFEAQRLRDGAWRPVFLDSLHHRVGWRDHDLHLNVPVGERARVRAVFRNDADDLGDQAAWDRFRVTR